MRGLRKCIGFVIVIAGLAVIAAYLFAQILSD